MRNKFSRDGNRRDVYVRTRYKQEEGKAKRSFRNESYLRDSMEEGPRKKGEGGRRWAAAPSRYIDRRRSARLFRILKGKFPFIRAGFSPAELFEGARLADSSSDGK